MLHVPVIYQSFQDRRQMMSYLDILYPLLKHKKSTSCHDFQAGPLQ